MSLLRLFANGSVNPSPHAKGWYDVILCPRCKEHCYRESIVECDICKKHACNVKCICYSEKDCKYIMMWRYMMFFIYPDTDPDAVAHAVEHLKATFIDADTILSKKYICNVCKVIGRAPRIAQLMFSAWKEVGERMREYDHVMFRPIVAFAVPPMKKYDGGQLDCNYVFSTTFIAVAFIADTFTHLHLGRRSVTDTLRMVIDDPDQTQDTLRDNFNHFNAVGQFFTFIRRPTAASAEAADRIIAAAAAFARDYIAPKLIHVRRGLFPSATQLTL